jgi:hypothetical protein
MGGLGAQGSEQSWRGTVSVTLVGSKPGELNLRT